MAQAGYRIAAFGWDKFWNRGAGKTQKGLRASVISLFDDHRNASRALSVEQTNPQLAAPR
jgi:hypothetical protein